MAGFLEAISIALSINENLVALAREKGNSCKKEKYLSFENNNFTYSE